MLLSVLILGSILGFALAWALGANDVANIFGTSVGAKVLTLRQAVMIASVFEFLGAFLMGANVVDTLRKDVIKPELYENEPRSLMIGMLAAETSSAVFLVIATAFKFPVSTTHSTFGAIIGFGIVAKGFGSVDWLKVGLIAVSWVASPILSGVVSAGLFIGVRHFVLRKENSFRAGMRFLPLAYAFTFAINCFFVMYKGTSGLVMDYIEIWAVFLISIGFGIICGFLALAARSLIIKWIDLKLARRENEEGKEDIETETFSIIGDERTALTEADDVVENLHANSEIFDPRTEELFSFLQILTAIFGSFAHGANDVANSIAPFAVIATVYLQDGDVSQDDDVQWWILVIGGIGIVIGLSMWGYRVMETIGSSLTKMTPSRGFHVDIGAALMVLIASGLGLPISSSYCKVGSVVAIGFTDGAKAVNWSLFTNIILSWIVTLPFASLVSAGLYIVFKQFDEVCCFHIPTNLD
eukprot:TRINITY_DN9038_c0_g1_i1.p1 TRINITY_DN9038_c0_g1~~TRINITY_DN9038_c0_g1_i1.p1  ORF type:complete len:469 (+),score=49.32 TRINITY_DN9038_c0_g1_i1:65-1471(+)